MNAPTPMIAGCAARLILECKTGRHDRRHEENDRAIRAAFDALDQCEAKSAARLAKHSISWSAKIVSAS
jgi:hypothetical protein